MLKYIVPNIKDTSLTWHLCHATGVVLADFKSYPAAIAYCSYLNRNAINHMVDWALVPRDVKTEFFGLTTSVQPALDKKDPVTYPWLPFVDAQDLSGLSGYIAEHGVPPALTYTVVVNNWLAGKHLVMQPLPTMLESVLPDSILALFLKD